MARKTKKKHRDNAKKTKRARGERKVRKIGPPYAPINSRELLPPIPSPV